MQLVTDIAALFGAFVGLALALELAELVIRRHG